MASRKRKPDETQEEYRAALKEEAKVNKYKLTHGRLSKAPRHQPKKPLYKLKMIDES